MANAHDAHFTAASPSGAPTMFRIPAPENPWKDVDDNFKLHDTKIDKLENAFEYMFKLLSNEINQLKAKPAAASAASENAPASEFAASMNELATVLRANGEKLSIEEKAPAMLYIPARGVLPDGHLHIPHIISIYHGGGDDVKVYIELAKRTVEIVYGSTADQQLARSIFLRGMREEIDESQHPKPIGGTIL